MKMTPSERLEDERGDRAFAWLMNRPVLFWQFVRALDALGWRITPQSLQYGDKRFPAPPNSKRKRWPSWIDADYGKPKLQLRVLDGGKRDDDEHR